MSKVVLCGRRNTFATFSEDALQFSWQAQHFGRVHLHFALEAQHFRRVVLHVFATRIVSATSSVDKVQILWQASKPTKLSSRWHGIFSAPVKLSYPESVPSSSTVQTSNETRDAG